MTEEKPRKVKILDATYNEELKIVKWAIKDIETEKEVTVTFNETDLLAFGFSRELTPDEIRFFCEELKGKEKNLLMKKEDLGVTAGNIKNATQEQLKEFDDKFEKYPYGSVIKDLENELNED